MSSIKEPYIISVWEEELIPAQDWYIEGEIISEEQYQKLSEQDKKDYRPHSSLDTQYIKEIKRLSSEEFDEVITNEKNRYVLDASGRYTCDNKSYSREEFLTKISEFIDKYERFTIMEHYEETQGVIVGSDEMDSVFNAVNPIFKENVNGNVELTFSIYYKIFDPDTAEFSMNPFVSMLTNEAKIKLKFRNKWYDLIIKSCQEDSTNYMFTYTCKDFYINELGKNGFKVELDAELENNQDTIKGLGKTILKDTDWRINNEKSDIIVESKVEPLYMGTLKYSLYAEKVNDYIPDQMIKGSDYPSNPMIPKTQTVKMKKIVDGEEVEETSEIAVAVLFFYSDISERKKEPQILAVFDENGQYINPIDEDAYVLDTNEDVITNGCNYRITGWIDSDSNTGTVEYSESALKDNLINIVEIGTLSIYERARAEKVVRSQKTGYDPEMDRFIAKYYKLDKNGTPDTDIEYYGYSKYDILRTNIAENLLANSDNFTSTDTGWIFDGVPEKRTKTKESGYVGQLFQRTAINEANPSSGTLFEESVLELSLKSKDDESRYYKDTQGIYYLIQKETDTGNMTNEPVLINSETAKMYEEAVFDLYKKYQREGVPGYGEKTDGEIETLFKEYLASIRYSKGERVAINTGVAANREKIKQLSPGEEYIFAVSLGKFKDGETPLELKKEDCDTITYGVEAPDAYYQFSEVDSDGALSYAAAEAAIKEYKDSFEANNMQYYQENTDYKGEYQRVYDETYNDLKEEYKKRYLRLSVLSHERTRENWQPGGRGRSNLLWGNYIGYFQIFLNVLRGTGENSEEECCDPDFLNKLSNALAAIPDAGSASEQVYYALVDRDTIKQTDSEGVVHTYYQGLYPEMVMKTMVHSQEKQKQVSFIYRFAYDIMGYDKGLYPEYDDVNKRLVNLTDSFNEFLFSEIYYDILRKWQGEINNNGQITPVWKYTGSDADKQELSSLLQATYIACYENTNTIFESVEHTKEYHLPSATNAKGGKYYQAHEATWVQKAKKAAEQRVRELEIANGHFLPPFAYEEDITGEGEEADNKREEARDGKEYFIQIFSGSYKEEIKGDEIIYGKYKQNLADYCYEKEQDWKASKASTELQSAQFNKQLKDARREWIKDFVNDHNYTYPDGSSMFGGTWYAMNLLEIYYKHWSYGKDIGTYTYNTDTYELNYTSNNTSEGAQGQLPTHRPISKEKERYGKVTEDFYNSDLKQYINPSFIQDEYGEEYLVEILGDTLTDETDEETKTRVQEFKSKLNNDLMSAKLEEIDAKIRWEPIIHNTHSTGATHFARIDNEWLDGEKKGQTKTEQEKTGGYVFDREECQVRLFDPYVDVLNATFIPVKDDNGDYVFDPFTWQYRPFRDWDSKEYRDPLTLEIDNNSGVPGDKVFHPLKLFDGHLGAWHDTPTRYNMIRKYEDPNANSTYKYLEEDLTITETGHYEGKDYQYVITYPKGYQTDVYLEAKKGKYIKANSVNTTRLFDFTLNGDLEQLLSFNGKSFINLFKEAVNTAVSNITAFFQQIDSKVRDFLGLGNDAENSPIKEFLDALNITNDEDADKEKAGLAISNATLDEEHSEYDEDRASIKLCSYKKEDGTIIGPVSCVLLDGVVNAGEIANGIQSKKIVEKPEEIEDEGTGSGEAKTKQASVAQDDSNIITEKYIKYRSYYWRHWGKTRYDYQPKICIQQRVNGITVYKPYNNIEDKKSEAYHVYPISEYPQSGLAADKVIFLKNRKTTYRQRVETDYESSKYKMEEVDKMNKNYWIEAPNGEDYLRHYQFGDGVTKLFDGHLGRWVQCYTATKVEADADDIVDENALPIFYMPYENIMIPYNQRIFDATKQLTRTRAVYNGENGDDIYVLHNDVYVTLNDYLDGIGYTFPLNYNGLKVSFIDNYDYDSSYFAIDVDKEQERPKYLEFDLGEDCQYIDLVVKENTLTSEVVKERWAYWIAPVIKGYSLTENPLSKLGMLFETSLSASERGTTKSNDIGRYAFLGMQMFKHIPYTKALKKITTSELTIPCSPKREDESDIEYSARVTKTDEMISTLNGVLMEVYGSNTYTILDFLSKVTENPDSLTILNGSPTLCSKNITVNLEFNDKGESELKVVEVVSEESETIPLFPGQAPDAEDLHFTNYYIYDPDAVDHPDSAIFEYVGQDYSDKFVPAYDETCEKIRSIKGKESNYFKLLQDCCSTFDCWMQKDIEHDPTTGQIKYYDVPVYTEIINSTENNNIEPQIFVGEEAKLDGTVRAAKRIHHKLNGKIRKVGITPEDKTFQQHCEYEVADRQTLDEKEQKLLLRLNRINNLSFKIEYMRVPDKQIYFKQFVGEEKWNGFKYGVNLKHIKRTIDSDQFSTRVIVKPNSNEFGKDKFCTIARAEENPIKENFIFDFSYYINNHLLNNSDLVGDLYTDVNTRLNYYPKLASLNRERDEIIVKQSSLAVGLDNVTAKYETAVQLRDAALDEITKLTQLLTSNYDTYGQIISIPWKYNKSQEYTQKRQTSAPGTTKIISDTYGGVTYTFEVAIPTTTTVAEYPKYNDTVRNYLDQMDTYQREYTNAVKLLEELEPEKLRIEAEMAEIEAYLEEIANKKNELNKLFYHKYSRYIQEGSWIDENYIDDNLYYLDALSVSRLSAKPKVTYDIGVIDVAAAYEYEEDRMLLESELGNRTYIEDTEFFGYRKDDHTKPYWELVIITEKTYNLTDPSQNQVKVRNYTTQFEDIFQTITAASQTLQFNEGSYSRMSSLMNENGTIKAEAIQETIADSDFIIMNSTNEDVKIDKTGVTITSPSNRANVVKLVSSGILISSDGGNHYATAITGDGINADLLLAGVINTDKLLIGGRTNPNFMWNKLGISSFKTDGDKIDYSSFVRMDQYGIYGIKNYSKDGRAPESMSINDAFEPIRLKDITENPKAVFGLTWEGFFLNAANGTGRVTIGTGQDFRMSERAEDQDRWIDRVVIGKLNNQDYYGFQLRNSNGSVVMETGDTGELYLKRKLRISNFGEEDTVQPYGWVHDDAAIFVNVQTFVQEKDVNGNLVFESKDTNGDGIFEQVPKMVYCDIYNPDSTDKDKIEKYRYPLYTVYKAGETYRGELEEWKGYVFPNDQVIYEPTEYFTSYYYRYETVIEEGKPKNKKKYYTLDEGILFAVEDTTKSWQDMIVNQLDRVTLGIVDTYSRRNNFEKVNVDGVYSSSEYLTKVFSVKANTFLPTEQFTQDPVDLGLIGENENFALFDNGNLYAKNAWIEGNIRATSGSFTGELYAQKGELRNLAVLGTIEVGQETVNSNTSYGIIKSKNDEWVINGDGTAYFNNVIVSGAIKTAIFERDQIQTVSGSLLIASGIAIRDIEVYATNKVKIILDSDNLPLSKIDPDFEDNSNDSNVQTINESLNNNEQNTENIEWVDISEKTETAYVSVSEKPNYQYDNNNLIRYKILQYGYGTDKNGNDCVGIIIERVTSGQEDILKKQRYVLFLGILEEQNGEIVSEALGIVINASSEAGFFPKESISIIDINKPGAPPKAQLGLLSNIVPENSKNTALIQNVINQYGLYCDNVYVKGTMVSEQGGENPHIAGITTTDTLQVIPPEKQIAEHVVFFAGTDLEQDDNGLTKNLSFYVTKEGSLYVSNGYFNGTIKTSKIVGNGTDYALDIIGETKTKTVNDSSIQVTKALRFSRIDDEDNQTDFLSFTTQGSFFYEDTRTETSTYLLSVLHNTHPSDTQPTQTINNYGIGMFGLSSTKEEIISYKLNFIEEPDAVLVSFYDVPLIRINDTGCHYQYETDGLGENCRSFTVMDGDQVIGINFQLKNI